MGKIALSLKIDVTKIDKARLFSGQKGTYLDATIFVDLDELDQYGNSGMITQDVSKEEKQQGVKGNILGNGKVFWKEAQQAPQQRPMNQAMAQQGIQQNGFNQAPQQGGGFQQQAPQQRPMNQAMAQQAPQQAPQQGGDFQQQAPQQRPMNQAMAQQGIQQNGFNQAPQQAPNVNPQAPSVDFDDDIPW